MLLTGFLNPEDSFSRLPQIHLTHIYAQCIVYSFHTHTHAHTDIQSPILGSSFQQHKYLSFSSSDGLKNGVQSECVCVRAGHPLLLYGADMRYTVVLSLYFLFLKIV